jgi:malate synthase
MNMPLAAVNRLEIEKQSFVPELIATFGEKRAHMTSDLINNCLEPSEILDQHFALQNGSHKDVKQYVVYFCHIMAFFADGTHCGLAQPKQFVAFLGCKEIPESIVLIENNVHIELVLNTRAKINGGASATHIELPAQSTFTSKSGDDYFVE